MSVRNFWIEAEIDGRKTDLSGGPRAKDGEMRIVISQREEGAIKKILVINCRVDGDELITYVTSHSQGTMQIITKR